MRLSGLHVDGFGHFHDQGLRSIPGGLVLFTGENESGKTTLMEFVRTVLFGFPRKGTRNDYPPLAGGNHGGRLEVVLRDGRTFTIERTKKQVFLAEAGKTPVRAEPAEVLLAGLDRSTFERIFAIGLSDLQGLGLLSHDQVRARLLAATSGLGATALPTAFKALDAEIDGLLKKAGRQTVINRLLDRLSGAESTIAGLQGEGADYGEALRIRVRVAAERERARSETEALRLRLGRIEQLDQARAPWIRLLAARARAGELSFAGDFPPNGLERFENLFREAAEVEEEERRLGEEIQVLEREAAGIAVDERLLEDHAAIEALAGEREKLLSGFNDLTLLAAEVRGAEEVCARRLRELGPDWTPEKLLRVDTSVEVRQTVQDFGRRMEAALREVERAGERVRHARETDSDARKDVETARAVFDRLPPLRVSDESLLRQRQEALPRVRALLPREGIAVARGEERKRLRGELDLRLASLKKEMEIRPGGLPSWLPWVLLLAAAGGASVAALLRQGVPAALLLAVGIAAATFLSTLVRRQARARADRLSVLLAESARAEQARKAVDAEIGNLAEEVKDLRAEVERLCREAGWEPFADLDRLEQEAGRVEEDTEVLRRRAASTGKVEEAEGRARQLRERFDRVQEELAEADRLFEALAGQWRTWLAGWGLDREVRPDGFEALLQAVEAARSTDQSLATLRERVARTEAYVADSRARIAACRQACGLPPQEGAGVEAIDDLRRRLEESRAALQRRSALRRRLDEVRAATRRCRERRGEKEARINRLFEQAGASGEDEFRRRARAFAEREDCRREVETNDLAMVALAGHPEARANLESELASTDPLLLRGEKEGVETRLRTLDEALSAGEREIGSLDERLSRMARDGRLGDALLEERTLREALRQGIVKWMSAVLCRTLLEKAREVYERERQPQVIREAGSFLETITGNRYRLLSTASETDLLLEDGRLQRKEEGTWSAGLADQVYLALRLGLAREFSLRAEPLPVLLDDILVRFDPARRSATMEVVLEFARQHQVLLFACHPDVHDAVAEALDRNPSLSDVTVTRYALAGGRILPG